MTMVSTPELADLPGRVTELEVKLGYAEDLVEELNLKVFRQQEQIDLLQRQLTALGRQLRDMAPAESGDLREEIPPHY